MSVTQIVVKFALNAICADKTVASNWCDSLKPINVAQRKSFIYFNNFKTEFIVLIRPLNHLHCTRFVCLLESSSVCLFASTKHLFRAHWPASIKEKQKQVEVLNLLLNCLLI